MLLYFKTSNNLSFDEEVTFTTVAGNYKVTNPETKKREDELPENLIYSEKYKVNLLRSSVIYGANASGKSNLLFCIIKSVGFIIENFANSNSSDFLSKYFTYNKTKEENKRRPIEITFGLLIDNTQFEYSFSYNDSRILSESLLEYKTQKPIEHYTRVFDSTKQTYDWTFSKYFLGEKNGAKNITNDFSLFLTVGSISKLAVSKKVFEWFRDNFHAAFDFDHPGSIDNEEIIALMYYNKSIKKLVLDQLKMADLGIIDFRIRAVDSSEAQLETFTIHNSLNEDGEIVPVEFDYDNESAGTKRFIGWIGYWIQQIASNKVILIDEFGTSMHSLLSKHLIETIKGFKINGKLNTAQLIFTTHDTNLLTRELFRPDQIWFTEKNELGNSKLYPLSQFKLQKGKDLESTYLQGLYGGIPHLKDREDD